MRSNFLVPIKTMGGEGGPVVATPFIHPCEPQASATRGMSMMSYMRAAAATSAPLLACLLSVCAHCVHARVCVCDVYPACIAHAQPGGDMKSLKLSSSNKS